MRYEIKYEAAILGSILANPIVENRTVFVDVGNFDIALDIAKELAQKTNNSEDCVKCEIISIKPIGRYANA